MSLEVAEHRRNLGGAGKESGEKLRRDLFDGQFMPVLIQRFNDFVEAQEITDEWQIPAIANLIRVKEGSSHDDAKFGNVTHVNATHIWIKRDSPAGRAVWQFLRPKNARKVLEIERRDD